MQISFEPHLLKEVGPGDRKPRMPVHALNYRDLDLPDDEAIDQVLVDGDVLPLSDLSLASLERGIRLVRHVESLRTRMEINCFWFASLALGAQLGEEGDIVDLRHGKDDSFIKREFDMNLDNADMDVINENVRPNMPLVFVKGIPVFRGGKLIGYADNPQPEHAALPLEGPGDEFRIAQTHDRKGFVFLTSLHQAGEAYGANYISTVCEMRTFHRDDPTRVGFDFRVADPATTATLQTVDAQVA